MMWWWTLSTALASTPCPDGARMRLACPVSGGNALSICEHNGQLTYRFGTPSTPDLTLSGGVELSHKRMGEDAEQHVISFWNDGHRYAVVVERTEDQFEAGVVVRKGAKKLTSVACREPLSADLTQTIGRFNGHVEASSAWVGEWDRGGDGTLTIVEDNGKLVISEGLALFHMGPDNVHTGEVRGPLKRTGSTATVTMDDCSLTLNRTGPDTLSAEDNGKCGGLNVRFDGDYSRQP